MTNTTQPVALITGASRGLGLALARSLADDGWTLVVDARDARDLRRELPTAIAVEGDVTDPIHREALAAAVGVLDRLDLLVNNASDLGPSPLPPLAHYPLEDLRRVYETNVVAPLALAQASLPLLRASGGAVLNISSDAAVEAYEGWGGYGPSKAALDHLSAILAAEEPTVHVWSVDPGDMRTAMHQAAFPNEDISDRPEPSSVIPALRRLIGDRPGSGRYRAAHFAAEGVAS